MDRWAADSTKDLKQLNWVTSFGPQPGGGIFFCSTIRLCPPPPAKLMPILRKTHRRYRRTACRSGRRKHLLQTKTALGVRWIFAWKETCYLDIWPGNAEVDLNLMFRSCSDHVHMIQMMHGMHGMHGWSSMQSAKQPGQSRCLSAFLPGHPGHPWASNLQHIWAMDDSYMSCCKLYQVVLFENDPWTCHSEAQHNKCAYPFVLGTCWYHE